MDHNHATALRFQNVSFSYGQTAVLDNINFHIHEGEFIALVGPNGTGKSTILKLALGLESPHSGSVMVYGKQPQSMLNRIGYVPQHTQYDRSFPISVSEVVGMGLLHPSSKKANIKQQDRISDALQDVAVGDLADRPYTDLSGGQRRRVLVARALISHPSFLILDEPTANMDSESESLLFSVLGTLKGKTTILIVTHDTEFVSSLTDRVLCLGKRGSCAGGATIVQHLTEPADYAHATLTGQEKLKVLHDVQIPGDACNQEGTLHE